jgi:hypothetical protein
MVENEFLKTMKETFEDIINRLDQANINSFCKPDVF